MDTTKPLVNKVAQKALVTLNLEDYLPGEAEVVSIDLKDYLFKGLILREADFRETVKNTNWETYRDKYVALYCSTDAILPMWAYMVLTAELSGFAKDVVVAAPGKALENFLLKNVAALDKEQFKEQRVVIKGCGDRPVSEAAYVQITQQLAPVARVIMYGEPCSTVPVFKKQIN